MDKSKDLHSDRYLRCALIEISRVKPIWITISELKDNNLLNAAAGLLGLNVGDIYPYEFLDLFDKDLDKYSTFKLFEKITRLKMRLARYDIEIDKFYSSLKVASRKNDDNRQLLFEAKEVMEILIKNYHDVVYHIEQSHIYLTLQSMSDVNGGYVGDIKKEVNELQENCITDIISAKKDILKELESKLENFEIKTKDFNNKFKIKEENIHNITQGLIEQIDKNFSSQQRTNLDTVTKQTRASINEIQLSAQKSTDMFHELLDSQIGNINHRIDKEISQFESHKLEIQGILGDISNAHQSNSNRIQADKEQVTADYLRLFGVLGLIFVIFFSLYLFNSYLGFFGESNTSDSQLTAQWFLVRFFTITLLTGPFIYLLKESASHRNKENLYRQRGTQLSSIGAYLSELDIQERTLLKKELARNFFSFHDVKADTQNVPDFLRDMKQFVGIARTINSPQNTASERLRRK
ncbi:hypothetical protein KIV40_09870 [Vibrio sp. D173a]|uniref:hypothetical protein n=1 Tax=Vibrio sp. D173a TaxID=2836349 RepID=UPI0025555616|nr:hypothetical protein [Vibrio sp. D173a]MDK9755726.1 hypothetical protein [Vibrio sp. D173a]